MVYVRDAARKQTNSPGTMLPKVNDVLVVDPTNTGCAELELAAIGTTKEQPGATNEIVYVPKSNKPVPGLKVTTNLLPTCESTGVSAEVPAKKQPPIISVGIHGLHGGHGCGQITLGH